MAGQLYFFAYGGADGVELWRTDGTETGTEQVVDINPNGDSSPLVLTVFNDHLFFSANDGTHGRELWISDGTGAGTEQLLELNPTGNAMTGFFEFSFQPKIYAGKLYFVASDGTNGWELWRTDGTPTGTTRVEPVGANGNSPLKYFTADFALFNGSAYFGARFDATGKELWRVSDSNVGVEEPASTEVGPVISPNPAMDMVRVRQRPAHGGPRTAERIGCDRPRGAGAAR